jgi:vitamin B12 transporter
MPSAKTSSFPKSMPRTAWLTFTALPALFATICSTANAQQSPNTSPAGSSSVQLGTIEVVSPTGIATPQNQVASSVTVITAEDLERDQRRTAMDALQEVPGINVTQTGGPGAITEVYIRGANPEMAKVLIDGIDVTDPSSSNQEYDFGQLLTGDIARIEVLRGPQSGFYGGDAMGGVISITTKSGQGPPKATFEVEGGSYGTFNQKLSLGGSQDNFNYYFTINHYQSASTPALPLDILLPGEQRKNQFYDNKTYSAKVGYDFNEDFSINATTRYTQSKLNSNGTGDDNFAEAPDFTTSTQNLSESFSRAEAVWKMYDGPLGTFRNYFGAAYSYTSTNFISPQTGDNGIPAGFGPSNFAGEREKVDWRGVWTFLPKEVLVMGLEDEHFDLTQVNPSGGTPCATPGAGCAASNANKAAYLELQTNFYDRFFFAANGRIDDNEQFGEHETFRLAPAFLVPFTDTKLQASWGTGFKAPTLEELFVNFPAFNFFANPHLLPETDTGQDFGFEQPLFQNKIRFGVTYYHIDYVNLIQANTAPSGAFETFENVGRARTYGTESFIQWNISPWLNLRADVTTTTAIDELTGQALLRRPRDKETIKVTWKPLDDVTFSTSVIHVGPWVDINNFGTVTGLPGTPYTLVNLALNWKYSDEITLFSRVDNLTNVQYQDPIGFLRPGLGIYGGVRLTELLPTFK